MQVKPSKEEFSKLAKQGNIVAVAAEVSTDLDTPVSIYYKLVGEEKGFMLESATINQQFGRFSFIGTEPLAEIDVFKGRIVIKGDGGNTVIPGSPVDALKVYLAGFDTAAQEAVLPLMNGGAVGYFNYEVVSTFDRIRGLDVADDQILGQFMICRVMIVVDHFKNTSQIVCLAEVGADSSAGEIYEAARQKVMAVKARLQDTVQPAPVVPKRGEKLDFQEKYGQVTPEFLEMIRRGKEYITAGDAFQIVLSEQFRCQVTQPAFNFYRRLRQVNPSAYMFYLNFGSKKLIGASPEMLVKISGDMVYTYPIAGSRRRGATAAEDEVLAAELCADTKECAEHAMLVDLSRNDVGRISYPGTVKVQKMMQVEKFSHNHASGIGSLRPGAQGVYGTRCPAGLFSGRDAQRGAKATGNGNHSGTRGERTQCLCRHGRLSRLQRQYGHVHHDSHDAIGREGSFCSGWSGNRSRFSGGNGIQRSFAEGRSAVSGH